VSEHEEDDGIDLDALDEEGGMEAVLAKYRADAAKEARRSKRPAWVSALVGVLGASLCVAMWADFRYWLNFERAELGQAEGLDAVALDAHDNEFVHIQGTPDVRHIVPVPLMDGRRLSLTRLQGGDDQLFVLGSSPVSEGGGSFIDEFEGRLRKASDLESFDALRQVYAMEGVSRVADLSLEALEDALANPGGVVQGTKGEPLSLQSEDRLVLVARPETVMLHLGRKSWKTPAAAKTAVESLGVPYMPLADTKSVHDDPEAVLPNTRAFYKYLVALPPERVAQAESSLNDGLDLGDENDPAVGALVLPQIATYTASFGDLQRGDSTLSFDFADNAASPGANVEGGKLVLRELTEGRLNLPWSELSAVRIERPVELGPEASVLMSGRSPKEKTPIGVSFVVVFAIVLVNLGGVVVALRRKED
jgi:hypothetical protein